MVQHKGCEVPCLLSTLQQGFNRAVACNHVAMQGTVSSKKKKMAKLKRVMAQVKKQDRREKRNTDQNFAAIQLLHDPQVRGLVLCAWPRSYHMVSSIVFTGACVYWPG